MTARASAMSLGDLPNAQIIKGATGFAQPVHFRIIALLGGSVETIETVDIETTIEAALPHYVRPY